MTAPRDYSEYLKDMLLEARLAQQFLEGVEYDEFIENPEKQRAVSRCIETVGEAARHIPEPIREKYPKVAWRDVLELSDQLVHCNHRVGLEKFGIR